MIVKFRYGHVGAHVRVQVFVADNGAAMYANVGALTFRPKEWDHFREWVQPLVDCYITNPSDPTENQIIIEQD